MIFDFFAGEEEEGGRGEEEDGRGGGRRRRGAWVEAKHFQTRTLSSWAWRSWAQRALASFAGRPSRLEGVRVGELWRKLDRQIELSVNHC